MAHCTGDIPATSYAPTLSKHFLLKELHQVCPSASVFTIVPGYPHKEQSLLASDDQPSLSPDLHSTSSADQPSSSAIPPSPSADLPSPSADLTDPSADPPSPSADLPSPSADLTD